MSDHGDGAGWRSRVKIVTENWKRKVQFSTPQAEKSINASLRNMRALMDRPMILDGEVQTDESGEPIPRRRFWQMSNPEVALELISTENVNEIDSLEQLADVIYIARFDPATLQTVLGNQAFLAKVARIRDNEGNNLLHWIAAAALPQKTLFNLSGELRKFAEDVQDEDETLVGQIAETLRAENHDSVKLHEIAFAMKDQHLATELMRAKFSVREKNRRGSDFVTETLRADGGEDYVNSLKSLAEEEPDIEEELKEELVVEEDDRERAARFNFADEIIENLRSGDQVQFKRRLQDAIDGERTSLMMFFEQTPMECAENRGLFHFGQLDREGNDWMFVAIERGDLSVVEQCMTLIERHVKLISDIFAKARPGLNLDEISQQLVRMYLKTGNARGVTLLQHAVTSKKVVIVQRLIQAGLFSQFALSNTRDLQRKREMLSKNMALLVGRSMKENLFLHAAMMENPRPDADDAAQALNVTRMLDMLFEQMTPPQAYALFQMTYKVGRPPRQMGFLDIIDTSEYVLGKAKEVFRAYAQKYAQAA
ncbi:MAG: hypothetical protein AAF684_01350 [Pseudomonadota bacterium]